MLLIFVSARSKLAHFQLALACQRSRICVQHKLQIATQHVYGHTGNLGNECAANPAALGSLGFIASHYVATRWFVTTLTHQYVLMAVTRSARLVNDCNTSAQMKRRYLKMGVSAVFTIGFFVCLSHVHVCVIVDFALSFLPCIHIALQKSNGQPNFVSLPRLW